MAFVVSTIFISVAFNLSRDLGHSLEIEHSNHILFQLKTRIKAIVYEGKFNKLARDVNVKNELSYLLSHDLNALLSTNVIGVEIWLNDVHIKLKSSTVYSQNNVISNAIKTNMSSYDFLENESMRLLWVYENVPLEDLSILLVIKTNALNKAISYVSNRLFITAFLIFWLTIWVGILFLGLISKQFKKSNERLKFLASHDVLTGLPNRSYLYQFANAYFSDENRERHQNSDTLLAIYVIDLDKFKDINDSMGHLAGDELLKSISTRLLNLKEKSAKAIRYGGDEFVVLCDNLTKDSAISLAEQIVTVCNLPIKIDDYFFETSVSVGVSYYPENALDLNTLLKNADIAMYYAKSHRLGFQVFQSEMFARTEFRINLRGQLNAALKQKQFVLYYQPKVQLPGDKIVGVEALVRWLHPLEGLLAPNMFIDLIEQSLFVHEFTRHLLLQAIIQCRAWLDNEIELSIAVNISPYNLMDPQLVSYLASQLKQYDVPASLIEIELTESATMVNIEKTKDVFAQLKQLGVKLSIDDFGTGMSSLAYIKQLDADYIKIDQSFITNLVKDERDEAVIGSLLILCQKLNKLTIAEGVETIEQANILTRLGCNLAQGHLYSKPLPVEEITKLLIIRGKRIDEKYCN